MNMPLDQLGLSREWLVDAGCRGDWGCPQFNLFTGSCVLVCGRRPPDDN